MIYVSSSGNSTEPRRLLLLLTATALNDASFEEQQQQNKTKSPETHIGPCSDQFFPQRAFAKATRLPLPRGTTSESGMSWASPAIAGNANWVTPKLQRLASNSKLIWTNLVNQITKGRWAWLWIWGDWVYLGAILVSLNNTRFDFDMRDWKE